MWYLGALKKKADKILADKKMATIIEGEPLDDFPTQTDEL